MPIGRRTSVLGSALKPAPSLTSISLSDRHTYHKYASLASVFERR